MLQSQPQVFALLLVVLWRHPKLTSSLTVPDVPGHLFPNSTRSSPSYQSTHRQSVTPLTVSDVQLRSTQSYNVSPMKWYTPEMYHDHIT